MHMQACMLATGTHAVLTLSFGISTSSRLRLLSVMHAYTKVCIY